MCNQNPKPREGLCARAVSGGARAGHMSALEWPRGKASAFFILQTRQKSDGPTVPVTSRGVNIFGFVSHVAYASTSPLCPAPRKPPVRAEHRPGVAKTSREQALVSPPLLPKSKAAQWGSYLKSKHNSNLKPARTGSYPSSTQPCTPPSPPKPGQPPRTGPISQG